MDGEIFWNLLKILILLPLVLLLAYIALRLGLGRMGPARSSSRMQVVDRLPLGPRSALLVVRVVDRYFLLAQQEHNLNLLQELPEYPETAAEKPLPLNAACGKNKQKQAGGSDSNGEP